MRAHLRAASLLLFAGACGAPPAVAPVPSHPAKVAVAPTPPPTKTRPAGAENAVLVVQAADPGEPMTFTARPDGKRIIASAWYARPRIWDVDTGDIRAELSPELIGKTFAWSPTEPIVATWGAGSDVTLWDPERNTMVRKLPLTPGDTGGTSGGAMRWSDDGSALALVIGVNVHVWDVRTGKLRFTREDHPSALGGGKSLRGPRPNHMSIAFAADGSAMAGISADSRLVVWGDEGEPIARETSVTDIAWSTRGKLLAIARDGAVRVMDAASKKSVSMVGASPPFAMAPDASVLASCTANRKLALWDAKTGRRRTESSTACSERDLIDFSPDGRSLSVVRRGDDAGVDLLDAATLAVGARRSLAPAHRCTTVDGPASGPWIADGAALLLRCDADAVVVGRDGEIRKRVHLSEAGGEVRALAPSPDADRIAIVASDGTHLFDVASGRIVGSLEPSEEEHAWNDGNSVFVQRNKAGGFAIWRANGTSSVRIAGQPSSGPVALSADGSTLAAREGWTSLELWDAITGSPKKGLTFSGNVERLAFSPDGRSLAVGTDVGTTEIVDVAAGSSRLTLTGHTKTGSSRGVWGIAWSPDGRLVATAGPTEVFVWDAATGARRAEICKAAESGAVTWVGTDRIACRRDTSIEIWSATDMRLVRTIDVGPNRFVTPFASRDGATIVAVVTPPSGDPTIEAWDSATGASRGRLAGASGAALLRRRAGFAAAWPEAPAQRVPTFDVQRLGDTSSLRVRIFPAKGSAGVLAYDAAGAYDGSDDAIARVRFRAGPELSAELLAPGPIAEWFRRPGLVSDFLDFKSPPR